MGSKREGREEEVWVEENGVGDEGEINELEEDFLRNGFKEEEEEEEEEEEDEEEEEEEEE